jgi:preprotein translocase subunit SecE
MKRISAFFSELYHEMTEKVSWPAWEELQESLIVVVVAALMLALIVFGMDKASDFMVSTYYDLFS